MIIENESGIYKIKNTVNGKVYVGSTLNIRLRKNNHFSALRNNRHSSRYLQYAFNKYGQSNFEYKVLEYTPKEHLEQKEIYWIKKLNATNRERGYNARVFVAHNRGLRHSEETRIKISKNRLGKGRRKYYISEELRQRKSELCKKQNLKQYHTKETEKKRVDNIRKTWEGRALTKEHLQAIQKSNRGSKNGKAKLTENEVVEIKLLLKDSNMTQTAIANLYNVSRRNIGMIKKGDRWGHIRIEDYTNEFGHNKQVKKLIELK